MYRAFSTHSYHLSLLHARLVQTKRRRRARAHGFTLLECLIAGVILAGFAAAIVASTGQSASAVQRSQDMRRAAQWLDEVLTRVDLIGPDRLALEGPLQGPLDDRFAYTLKITPDDNFVDLYQVTATVIYATPHGAQRSASARTRLYDPLGSHPNVVNWEGLQ